LDSVKELPQDTIMVSLGLTRFPIASAWKTRKFTIEVAEANIATSKANTIIELALTLSTAEAGRFSLLGCSLVGCSSPF